MTATELITELQRLVDKHGDLDVTAADLNQEYTLTGPLHVDGNLRAPSRVPVEERPERFLFELNDSIPFADD